MPTRTRAAALTDLLVPPGRDDLEHPDRLRHVLEGTLAEALEDEVLADPLRRRRADDDLPTFRGAGEARGDVGRRPARGERPARAELSRRDERLAGVDAHVQLHGREDAAVLLVRSEERRVGQ